MTRITTILREGREIKNERDVAMVAREFHSHLQVAVKGGYRKFTTHLQAEEPYGVCSGREPYEKPAVTATHDPADMLFDLQRLGTMMMLYEKSLLGMGEPVPTSVSNMISRLEPYKR